MPTAAFEAASLLPAAPDGGDGALCELLQDVDPERLIVPKAFSKALFEGRGAPTAYPIFDRNLLSRTYTDMGRIPPEIGPAADLAIAIQDETGFGAHVILMPNLYYATRWHRRDDDLDYAMERWRGATDAGVDGRRGDGLGPRDFLSYVPFGHHPWTNSLMDLDGNPVAWTDHVDLARRPDIVPAVPSEIRWWLTTLGVMDDAGVNGLRPVVAQWWS